MTNSKYQRVATMASSCPWIPVSLGTLLADPFLFAKSPQAAAVSPSQLSLCTGKEVALLSQYAAQLPLPSSTVMGRRGAGVSHKIQNQLLSALQALPRILGPTLFASPLENGAWTLKAKGIHYSKPQTRDLLQNLVCLSKHLQIFAF